MGTATTAPPHALKVMRDDATKQVTTDPKAIATLIEDNMKHNLT